MSQEFDPTIVTGVLEEFGKICEEVCEDLNNDILAMRSRIQILLQEKLETRNFPVDETTIGFLVSAIILTIFNL